MGKSNFKLVNKKLDEETQLACGKHTISWESFYIHLKIEKKKKKVMEIRLFN